jgi:ABC-type antimicrobial peptide transport system permease subunit
MTILKIALRSLMHYKLYSVINILGLTMSLTCVIIISRYVYSELTVDSFNKKLDRIYITTWEESYVPGGLMYAGILRPNLTDLSKHSGVEKRADFIQLSEMVDICFDNQTYNTNVFVADSSFLQILDFPIIVGAHNIFRPGETLITEAFAKKIFGKENPVGKKLHYPAIKKDLTVTGVIGKPRTKSSLSFDMLLYSSKEEDVDWGDYGYCNQTLILLYPGVHYEEINKQYGEWKDSSMQMDIRNQLYPYKNVYFGNKIDNYLKYAQGNYLYVIIISVVGVLLLLIGTINYINIYTVVIVRRNKEFGMKKVFGAEGYKVFFQLLLENMLLVALSLVLALGLAELVSPAIENILDFEQFPNAGFTCLLSLLLLFLLPLITSITPFIRYHYASPVQSLQSVRMNDKSLFSRQFFLTFQYFITMTMITISLFFVKQLHFMLHQDLGYRTQNIIIVPFIKYEHIKYVHGDEYWATEAKLNSITDELKQKLDASTLIENWTACGLPPNEASRKFKFRNPGEELQTTTLIGTDENWFKLFEIQLLDGRLWDNNVDVWWANYVLIVSESTLKQFGITNYREAELDPSSVIWFPTSDEDMNKPFQIVGVVKDFYIAHLSQKQYPIIIYCSKGIYPYTPIMASFAEGRRQEAIEFMRNLHDELIGGEFTYSFVEDEVAALYKEDKKVATICSVFTVIAILISILGLFGLSLFEIRQRRKEVAIRKVNGALTKEIIRLLLKKYFVLLGIGFAVSVPVALFAIHRYLENFAFQAPVSWWLFGIALAVTAAVSLLTLIYQTHKASNENPAEVLKSE